MCWKCFILLFSSSILTVDSARILAVYPMPSISHQVVFRRVTLELVKQGHEVTVITTDPVFPDKGGPHNLIEIDLHNVSYGIMKEIFHTPGEDGHDTHSKMLDFKFFMKSFSYIFERQIQQPAVKQVLFGGRNRFDLILIEEIISQYLAVSSLFDAPVILFSSYGGSARSHRALGFQTHPLLYPSPLFRRVYNLTFWEKIDKLFKHYYAISYAYLKLEDDNELIRKHLGADVPALSELYKNVDMFFININSIWVDNQPVPANVVYLGGLHQTETKELPKDLKSYLDASEHGVIYVSFGTNALSTILPMDKIEMILRVLGQLPYDVLWKWDKDELPGRTENIKISKWLPQADLLKHPKIKLFITQGGLQSTDEAITAGVPLIAFPVLGDQWFNAEKYVHHGIGVKIEFDEATEDIIRNAVEAVISNESYRQNVRKLGERMRDQPLPPLERALFWINYVIRHRGAKHLRAAAANQTWAQYLAIDVLLFLICGILILSIGLSIAMYCFYKLIVHLLKNNIKLKRS